uniref:Uncharacterized protein n=1 Tax=Panagrolaimus sp. ES5 TaxID=591445 RepID=A0AC34GTE1_9BILA
MQTTQPTEITKPPAWMTVLVVTFGLGFIISLIIISVLLMWIFKFTFGLGFIISLIIISVLLMWIFKCFCFSRHNKKESATLTSQESLIPDIVQIKKDDFDRPAKASDVERESNPKALRLPVQRQQTSDSDKDLQIAAPPNVERESNPKALRLPVQRQQTSDSDKDLQIAAPSSQKAQPKIVDAADVVPIQKDPPKAASPKPEPKVPDAPSQQSHPKVVDVPSTQNNQPNVVVPAASNAEKLYPDAFGKIACSYETIQLDVKSSEKKKKHKPKLYPDAYGIVSSPYEIADIGPTTTSDTENKSTLNKKKSKK